MKKILKKPIVILTIGILFTAIVVFSSFSVLAYQTFYEETQPQAEVKSEQESTQEREFLKGIDSPKEVNITKNMMLKEIQCPKDTKIIPPTEAPTVPPTEEPTEQPTETPTEEPTEQPTETPTEEIKDILTEENKKPTEKPTQQATKPNNSTNSGNTINVDYDTQLLLAKVIYEEAGNCSEYCQWLVGSTAMNLADIHGSLSAVAYNVNIFNVAYELDSSVPSQLSLDVAKRILSGDRDYNVKAFRMWYYHNFGTPYTNVDGVYFSTY